MKPRIGKVVYTIFRETITKTKVEFLGETSFLTECWRDYQVGFRYEYDLYNVDWFTSLAKAKKYVMDCLDEEEKKKVEWYEFSSKDYWELVYKEEF